MDIEVLANFYKGNIQIMSIAIDGDVIKITDKKMLPAKKFKDKNLKYFEVSAGKKKYIIAFNPNSIDWALIS